MTAYRKVDIRLPGKENSNSHDAWPVHIITTMIKWIRTSRLSIRNSLSLTAFELIKRRIRGFKRVVRIEEGSGRGTAGAEDAQETLPRVAYHQVYNVY